MKARVAIYNRSIEIGWPDAGEALWTCGQYGAFVPLRIVAEARQRRGFSCVAICYDLIRNNHPEWNADTPHRALYDCSLSTYWTPSIASFASLGILGLVFSNSRQSPGGMYPTRRYWRSGATYPQSQPMDPCRRKLRDGATRFPWICRKA